MKRRTFVKRAGIGLAAAGASGTIAAPAIAQSQPTIKWRMATSWPKSLDTLFGAAERIAQHVSEATDQKFQIRVFAGGEIVPPLQVLDAVQNNTVELGHTAAYYYVGKDPTFTFDCTVPFGYSFRQQNAWMTHGGGLQLLREFYKDYNVYQIPSGNTGAQMGGWYRKEIKTVEDLKGLKFRIGGWAGAVVTKLGVVPQQLAGGDIYPSLEKGTIDAAEWVGPYDDEKLGFYKVAKYYYYPGWWEGQTQNSTYVNLDQWNKLPKSYKAILETACSDALLWMIGKYDTDNPAALRRLVAKGAILKPFSKAILEASYKASYELYEETAAGNPKFKKIYEPWKQFRQTEIEWFRVEEWQFENFIYSHALPKKA